MILITGGSGTLGNYLLEQLNNSQIDFEAPSRSQLNLSSRESVKNFFKDKAYKFIVHLAAETNVDLCEKEPYIAYLVNSMATEELAKYSRMMNAKIIYISTSAVFGRTVKLKYSELDIPMPINLYGNSKLLGEQSIRNISMDYLIIRSSWMIGGGSLRDKKFISKILPNLQQNKDVAAVYDKLGSLTYAKDLASFIVHAIKSDLVGTRHFSSEDYCSRYDIAKFIADYIGSKSMITKIDSQNFPLPAPRPISEALHSLIPNSIMKNSWQKIIEDYLTEWL